MGSGRGPAPNIRRVDASQPAKIATGASIPSKGTYDFGLKGK